MCGTLPWVVLRFSSWQCPLKPDPVDVEAEVVEAEAADAGVGAADMPPAAGAHAWVEGEAHRTG
jgi:hypothetical protein